MMSSSSLLLFFFSTVFFLVAFFFFGCSFSFVLFIISCERFKSSIVSAEKLPDFVKVAARL
jgi:hypothetical protein